MTAVGGYEGYGRLSAIGAFGGGGGGNDFSWRGGSNGAIVEPRAQVPRRRRRRIWKNFLAIKAMKIKPKITDAATITPTTTLGRPDLELVLSGAFALALLVFTGRVDVLVMVDVVRGGGGVVGTGVERVEDVDLVELELDEDEDDREGVGVCLGVVDVRVFVEEGSSGPRIIEMSPPIGSSCRGSGLSSCRRCCRREVSRSRAARASRRFGT